VQFRIAVLPGDGIGPEITTEAVKVLKAVGGRFNHDFGLEYGLLGGVAIDKTGAALPDDTLELCRASDAVLLGAVGDPKWDNDPQARVRPEDGLLALRKGLKLFANLRPIRVFPVLVNGANLKPEVLEGVDFIFVRELTGGIYFGLPRKRWRTSRGWRAVDTMSYSEREIERIVHVGFELARARRRKLVSVDKANVLESSRLWRQVTNEVAKSYPDVGLEHMFVDACAMRLIQNPAYFDVVVTSNMFGDILTDEASMLAGSLGMLPSASLAGVPREGDAIFGLYEPAHGSAPRRAGQNVANPLATILSTAMMLRYSFGLAGEAQAVEGAVAGVLDDNYRTYDIMSEGKVKVGTSQMGDLVAGKVGS
jgi:3-isopropylmalate dehydrogenase